MTPYQSSDLHRHGLGNLTPKSPCIFHCRFWIQGKTKMILITKTLQTLLGFTNVYTRKWEKFSLRKLYQERPIM